MSGWTLVTFLIGLIALILAVPPMLGWSKDLLLFLAGILVAVCGIGWLFAPVPKPYSQVNCGSVAQPKYEWIGTPMDLGLDPLGNGRIGAYDFHEACAHNRSEARWQAAFLGLVGVGTMAFYGYRERRHRDPLGNESV